MSLDQLIREMASGEDEPAAFEATVLRDVDGPDEELKLRIPSFDRRHIFSAIGWAPRVEPGSPPEVLLPEQGDRALVVPDENGEAWCLTWWPSQYGG